MTETGIRADLFTEFQERGVVHLPGLMDDRALNRLRAACERVEEMARGRTESSDDFVLEAPGVGGWVAWQRGLRPMTGVIRSVSRLHTYEPEFSRVAEDMRVREDYAEVAVGRPVSLINSFLWAKPGRVGSEKPWHQDMAFAPPGFSGRVVSVWVAMDEATTANGCLEFVPGSHRMGVFEHVGDRERTADEARLASAVEPRVDLARVLPDAEVLTMPLEPGSAVMFDAMMLHRSAPNTIDEPRRGISFVYMYPGE